MNKKQRFHEVVRKKIYRKSTNVCEHKIRYSDINHAMAGAMRTIESVEGITEMYYYKCNICYGFHLTKSSSTGNTICVM